MHWLHFRWRNINNKTIMSRFWPNSKPHIFVTGKFLIYKYSSWMNLSRPGQWATLPLSHLLRQRHGSRVLILSLIITQAPSISTILHSNRLSYSNVCVLTFKQAFCLILVKNSPKNVTRNAEFHVQVSSHTVMRVTNYVTTLDYSSQAQDFKGEYFKKQQSFFTA